MAQREANTSNPRKELLKRIENDLALHPPVAPYIGEVMDALRAKAKEFAYEVIDKGVVPSREVSMALTLIEQALFYAIASIARYQSEF
jgi:hypothetical protein